MKKTNTSDRLKELMSARDVKQVDVTAATGITKGALSSYISGRYEPKQDNVYLLAKYFNVNEAWLMGYDVPMDRKTPAASSPSDANIVPIDSLSPDEAALVRAYRSFNKTGKAKLMDYVGDLEDAPKNLNILSDSDIGLIEKDNLA